MQLYHVNFDGLDQARRDAVVTFAESSPEKSIPHLFFERVRFDLLGLYYASPASWAGLGISSPPQPNGYPDYMKPPRERSRG